jgi:CBS domain-containing protein
MKAKDIMSTEIVTVKSEETVQKALHIMKENNLHTLLVEENGEIKKMITKHDLIYAYSANEKVENLAYSFHPVSPDTELDELVELIFKTGQRAFPVKEGEKIVGIVTDMDIMKNLEINALVQDVMTYPAIVIEENESIGKARSLLRKHNIGRLPVVKDGKLVGIVTEEDIIEVLTRNFERKMIPERTSILELPVKDVMKSPVIYVKPTDEVKKAIELMVNNKIKGLPVCFEEIVVGMITRYDILKYYLKSSKAGNIEFSGEVDEVNKSIIISEVNKLFRIGVSKVKIHIKKGRLWEIKIHAIYKGEEYICEEEDYDLLVASRKCVLSIFNSIVTDKKCQST